MQLLYYGRKWPRMASTAIVNLRTYSTKLRKKSWKPDVVYLYQFPRAPLTPNLSPFCLKVETFLRAHDIKYEVNSSWMTRSAEGRLPFIELNGKQIADSQVIFWRLMDHFKIDYGLDAEQQARARAIERLVEGSVYYALMMFCSYENATNMANPRVSGLPIPGFLIPFVAKRLAETARKRLSAEGTLRHPREVTIEVLRRDLEALTTLLGDKKFFIGIRPTVPDFCAFGHLGVALSLPFDHPAKSMLEKEERLRPLRMLVERMRLHYWPKWPKG